MGLQVPLTTVPDPTVLTGENVLCPAKTSTHELVSQTETQIWVQEPEKR